MSSRDAQSVADALEVALKAAESPAGDSATVALARRYAALLDADPDSTVKVGPLLLDALRELGMTPRARAAVVGKGGQGDGGKPRSKWDELEERRAARRDGAAAVDSSAP